MGATAHYKSVSPRAMDLLKANPWLVEAFLCWERHYLTISPFVDSLSEEQRAAWRTKIERALPSDAENGALTVAARRHPEEMEEVRKDLDWLQAEWDASGLDIDKAWRGILSRLDVCPPDLAEVCRQALSAGIVIGPNLGYAPAEYHEASAVAQLAARLPEAVQAYASADADYLRELEYVRDYYVDAARQGKAMLLHLA